MDTRKLKVLALVEAQVVTAPAKILLNFASECRDSVDLTLVTFVRGARHSSAASASNVFLAATRDFGIPVEVIPESGRFDRSVLTHLRRLFSQYQPDIVQTNSIKSHFLVALLRNRPFSWLAFHHGYTAEDIKMRLYNQLDRFSLRACDQVITVCQAFARQLHQRGVRPNKVTVIPNGLAIDFAQRDDGMSREWRSRFGATSEDYLAISIGRLSTEKGQKYLIEAAARLKSSGRIPDFKILIVGSGPLEASLKQQISVSGVSDCVQLIGHQGDVRPLFNMADVFVLPSLSEGSPMVLLESMSARLPIIATNVGGIPEAVADGESALLVPPASPQPLSDAIQTLAHDRELAHRLADSAFERLRSHFSPALYNARVLASYRSALKRRSESR